MPSCRELPLTITLLPKKGDLSDLRNWLPVALLCADIEIFSESLANRLKGQMETIIHHTQSYCVPGWSIHDDLHLSHDMMDLAKLSNMNFGLLSLDQERAFDRVDHGYLFKGPIS